MSLKSEIFWVTSGFVAIVMIVALWMEFGPEPEPIPITPSRTIYIDGWDSSTLTVINPVNVWSNYESRTFGFTIPHGAAVTEIRKSRDGTGILIRDDKGREGWVYYEFISKYK